MPNKDKVAIGNIHPLFPIIVHQFEIEDFENIKDDLLEYVYGERENDPKGIWRSNSGGGWHSQNNYHEFENVLNRVLQKNLERYFLNQDIFKSSVDPHIVGLWININGKGNYNIKHMHPECHLSGTLYLKVPENSGEIELLSPNQFSQWDEMTVYSDQFKDKSNCYPTYKFPPHEAMIIMFPGNLLHRVNENKSEGERISVAFSIDFK